MKPIKWILRNRFLFVLYLFSTAFFVLQHYMFFSWDFAVYAMNSEFMFFDGNYFEWGRPPLTQFIMGITGGIPVGEYAYIILVSALFLFATLKLSEVSKTDPRLLYAIMLNPAVLVYGMYAGTELLSLSLLMLFVSYIVKGDSVRSGVSGALAFLSRYTNYLYYVLAVFTKDWRKTVKILVISFLVALPWLGYNYALTGNPLLSIEDQYAMNVKYRLEYIFQQPDPFHLLLIGNYLIVLAAFGVYKAGRKWSRLDIMMIAFLGISLLSYYSIPIKVERYAFNIVLPLAYFSVMFLKNRISHSIPALINASAIVILMAMFFANIIPVGFYEHQNYDINGSCMTASNNWVELDYQGIPSEPPPREWQIGRYIGEGYRIVIFKDEFFDDVYSYYKDAGIPVIEDRGSYVIYGDPSACKETGKVEIKYIERLERSWEEKP